METLVLVVEADGWDLRTLEQALEGSHQVRMQQAEGFLEISQDASSAYVCIMRPPEDGLFEGWPKELIPEGPFIAFSIDYRKPVLVESIIKTTTIRATVVIDTNFGDVMSGRDFLSRVAQEEGAWEWWRWDDDR